jgi:transposase-like protein
MNYYEVEFKLKIVKEYLESPLGGRAFAKKYSLSSNSLIYSWKDSYQLFGKEGLITHRSPKKWIGYNKLDRKDKVCKLSENTLEESFYVAKKRTQNLHARI